MSSVVDFLRRQLFLILCAVGALIGIGLMVTGYMAMPKVLEQMKAAETIYTGLGSVQNQSANGKFIEAAEKHIREIKQSRDEVVGKAASLHQFKPLVDGVFPDGNTEKRTEFQKKYMQAMTELFMSLRPGEPPDATEIRFWEDKIEEERYKRAQQEKDPSQPPPPPIGPTHNEAGVLTPDGARTLPEERASIAKAQQIDTYAIRWDNVKAGNKEKVSSLQFDDKMVPKATLEAPEIDECWWAQVGYWIQKDVVDAIVATNKEASEQFPEETRRRDTWVANLPIKELISLRVKHGFVEEKPESASQPAAPGGYNAADPPDSCTLFFTQTCSSAEYDVIHFTVKMVADQRDLLKFVEKLTSNHFYNNLRIDYRRVPPNRGMKGKIYGPEPVVNVVMDFEAIFVSGGVGEGEKTFSEFRRLMPPTVCEATGVECPEPAEPAGGENKEG